MNKVKKGLILFWTIALPLAWLLGCNPEEDDLVDPSTLNQWTYFKTSDGLPSNNIVTLYEDKTGRIWIGTDAGLSVYDGSSFKNYTTADGLLSNNVYALLEDEKGRIWAGTGNGLNVLQDGKWLYFIFFYGAEIGALVELSNNDIIIGTGGYGVFRADFSDNTVSEFDVVDNCELCNSIYSLYLDSEENIWIGSFAGARRIRNQTTKTFNKASGLSGEIVTDFREDSFGNIWVGCVDGTTVSRISGNHVEAIHFSNGSPQNFTGAIEMDQYKNMWIGTIALGLYKYDGSFMHRVFEGPPGNSTRAMLIDSKDALWIGTTTGLARYVVGSN